MNWKHFRLTTRLNFKTEVIEKIYESIAIIDGVKNSWRIMAHLLPQNLRIEAKDQEAEDLYKIVFEPTPPHLVKKEMQELIEWYQWADAHKIKHPLILIANFIFEYLAIHPFQDGNGRTSRLLTNMMLLQKGYLFVPVVSHERIVEARKADYYLALNKTQKSWKTADEDVSPWILFFLKSLELQAEEALRILETDRSVELSLSDNQHTLLRWATENPDTLFSRKDAIAALGLADRTTESVIKRLVELKKLQRLGIGRATRYKVLL